MTHITVSLDPVVKYRNKWGLMYVVLLDSKCHLLLANEDKSYPDFWKSTQKVIAAPKQLHEKLGDVPAEADWCEHMEKREH